MLVLIIIKEQAIVHLFLLHFVGRIRCSRQTLNRDMGDEMRWIHLGSTCCAPSLAQIGGLIMETSLPICQQCFFKNETCGTISTQKAKDAEEVNNSKIIYPDNLSTERTLQQTQFIIWKLNGSLRISKYSYQCHMFKALDQIPSKHCLIWHSSITLLISIRNSAFYTFFFQLKCLLSFASKLYTGRW